MNDKSLYCSFCGKGIREVKRLIAGETCHICDECTTLCFSLLHGNVVQELMAIMVAHGYLLLNSKFGQDQYGFTKWQLEKGLRAVLNKLGVYSSGNEG